MRDTVLPCAVLASVMTAIYLSADIGCELARGAMVADLAPSLLMTGACMIAAAITMGRISRLSRRGL